MANRKKPLSEEDVEKEMREIDQYMEIAESAATAAREHLAKGRLGDAVCAMDTVAEFNHKAGTAGATLIERMRSAEYPRS